MSFTIHVPDHVLYEDNYIMAVNKPSGLMVEPDRNNHPNLLQQVRKYLKDKSPSKEIYAQHIHRLDRPVSGIILFAIDRSVLKNLSEQFAERKVIKRYQALTTNSPLSASGTLTNWLRKEKKKAVIYDEEIEFSEQVVLDYSIKPYSKEQFLWHIHLHTGKYHQIRAQLSHINCPVVGDSIYGSPVSFSENAIALHASRLSFHHPVSNDEMTIESERW